MGYNKLKEKLGLSCYVCSIVCVLMFMLPMPIVEQSILHSTNTFNSSCSNSEYGVGSISLADWVNGDSIAGFIMVGIIFTSLIVLIIIELTCKKEWSSTISASIISCIFVIFYIFCLIWAIIGAIILANSSNCIHEHKSLYDVALAGVILRFLAM